MNKALLLLGAVAAGAAGFAISRSSSAVVGDGGPPVPDSPGEPFRVTASSGRTYDVRFVKAFDTEAGHQTFYDVLDLQGNRLLRYTQFGSDMDSRVYIVSPLSMSDPRVDQVMRDFGIRFEGGANTDEMSIELAAGTKLLPGQLLVMAGEYLATVSVPFPKSVLVSASLISNALTEQGFRQVAVFTKAPADWPISKDGDYFIQAVWDKNAKIFTLPREVVDIRSRALA